MTKQSLLSDKTVKQPWKVWEPVSHESFKKLVLNCNKTVHIFNGISGLTPDIFKMKSWNHTGCTLNIFIK